MYYTPIRKRNLYDKNKPFKISRSKLDLFIKCPRCFYLDRKLGVNQPPGFPFTLNNAVDALLKREFDHYREQEEKHPIMERYNIDAIPYAHEKLDDWRNSLHKGVMVDIPGTKITITGGLDDVWINRDGELHVVDYKATAKADMVTLDADWQDGYKRQAEVYQWLLRKNNFNVSDVAYFVYCNGNILTESFDSRLNFNISVIPYKGDDSWIDETIHNMIECLNTDKIPKADPECEYCLYVEAVNSVT